MTTLAMTVNRPNISTQETADSINQKRFRDLLGLKYLTQSRVAKVFYNKFGRNKDMEFSDDAAEALDARGATATKVSRRKFMKTMKNLGASVAAIAVLGGTGAYALSGSETTTTSSNTQHGEPTSMTITQGAEEETGTPLEQAKHALDQYEVKELLNDFVQFKSERVQEKLHHDGEYRHDLVIFCFSQINKIHENLGNGDEQDKFFKQEAQKYSQLIRDINVKFNTPIPAKLSPFLDLADSWESETGSVDKTEKKNIVEEDTYDKTTNHVANNSNEINVQKTEKETATNTTASNIDAKEINSAKEKVFREELLEYVTSGEGNNFDDEKFLELFASDMEHLERTKKQLKNHGDEIFISKEARNHIEKEINKAEKKLKAEKLAGLDDF